MYVQNLIVQIGGGAVLALLLASILVVSCSGDTPPVAELGVDYDIEGETTYRIFTALGLAYWNEQAQSDPSLSARLEEDIDMSGYSNWTPVGDYYNRYTGTFDGSGYTISNLTISSEDIYAGMFGYIGSYGRVENLGLIEADITGSGYYTGSIAGYNTGTITACYNTGDVTGTGSEINDVGGIAGINRGTITACYSTGDVTGTESDAKNLFVGGIVGFNPDNGIITACYSTATVSGGTGSGINDVGGIVGFNWGTTTACYWSGKVMQGEEEKDTDVGSSDSDEGIIKVDGDEVTWTGTEDTSAKNKMNEALSDAEVSYKYVGDNERAVPPLTLEKTST